MSGVIECPAGSCRFGDDQREAPSRNFIVTHLAIPRRIVEYETSKCDCYDFQVFMKRSWWGEVNDDTWFAFNIQATTPDPVRIAAEGVT
jgi:hypothetical protein